MLVEAGNEKYRTAKFDEFMQAKQERMDAMYKLKGLLIRNGLPTTELIDLSAKFKAEIKALAEEMVERFGRKGDLNLAGGKVSNYKTYMIVFLQKRT